MTVKKKIYQIISDKLGIPEKEFNDETLLDQDLGADSLDYLDIILECEKEFNIMIPDEDISDLLSVGDFVKYVERKVK